VFLLLPIMMLMNEHAVIKRAGVLSMRVLASLERGEPIPLEFLADAADFALTYMARCHHDKEERVLFYELSLKRLPPEMEQLLAELAEEHRLAAGLMNAFAEARYHLAAGEGEWLDRVKDGLRACGAIYPAHIEREEKQLFLPAMQLFSEAEQHMMARTFREMDTDLLHSRYIGRVALWEDSEAFGG
jgi:hemerythrin-like domain-containing protein